MYLGSPERLTAKPSRLQIFAIDVEGGQATLIVSPSGKSLLIDAGWLSVDHRDADRIVAAARSARINKIDYLLITHYHRDHVGGVPLLAERIHIGTFIDHGPNVQTWDTPGQDYAAYLKVIKGSRHIIAKPGYSIPIRGLKVQVISSAGMVITQPLTGAGQLNKYCGSDPAPPNDPGENAQSLGTLITYGKFRFLDLGDLTQKKELAIFCPQNLLGNIDLFLVSHHGLAESNSKAMVWTIRPRVAILDNGAHKGANPIAWQIVRDSPGLQGFWQLHYAIDAGKEHNVPEEFIANLEEGTDRGNYIKVLAQPDGSFTVTNTRNNLTKLYTN
ncbi:MAG: ComEC/Rec2 family competence protein [Terriglobales bacterium]